MALPMALLVLRLVVGLVGDVVVEASNGMQIQIRERGMNDIIDR
jgi:hypothetical protein